MPFNYAPGQILQEWLSPCPADRDRLRVFGWEVMAGGRQVELNARLIGKLDHSRGAAIDWTAAPRRFCQPFERLRSKSSD